MQKESRNLVTRTRAAAILTALWIAFGIFICLKRSDLILTMKLNEIGDFLAGYFSPVAFLWLVVGYFQQGEELSLNTKALQLQVEELKLSVEQQRELVEVTRADMNLTKKAYDLEINRENRKAQPTFSLQVGSYNSGGTGASNINAGLHNHGHSAKSVSITCSSGTVSRGSFPVISSGATVGLAINPSPPAWDFDINVDYLDGLDQKRRQIFSAIKDSQGNLMFLPPKEIDLTDC